MTRRVSLLIGLLVVSVSLNVFLLLRSRSFAPTGSGPTRGEVNGSRAPGWPASEPRPSSHLETLERELRAARAQAAILDSIDPTVVAIYSSLPLKEKLVTLMRFAETDRKDAVHNLASRIAADPGLLEELIEILQNDDEGSVLELIAELLIHPAMTRVGAEYVETFFDLTEWGDLPDRRRAAMRPLYRFGIGEGSRSDFRSRFAAILRNETDPEVLAYGLQHFDWWSGGAPPDTHPWLKNLVRVSTDESVRRRAAIAYARGPVPEREICDLIERAVVESERAAWTDALSRVLNAGSSGENLQDPQRFFGVVQRETRLKTRQNLLRGMLYRTPRPEWRQLLEGYSAVESDADQRDRLRQLAELIDSGKLKGSRELDALIYGRSG